ncbi:hypothetical protein CJ030_MR4G010561 [Morella rubra]|uniref:RNase H type-1 domain-containing protein n=1 Tax=Morella rubra TaxID=262757 RepID=A0A6A1VV61_9ROSI|nr:hypothetical protein CJ030_MR4G010561 [Morella rubra]
MQLIGRHGIGRMKCVGHLLAREGTLKINFDVAVKEGNLFLAAVCRNSSGAILHIRTNQVRGSQPPKVEALAARMAFALGMLFTDCEIIFEGDSLILVHQVVNEECIPDWLIEGEVETIRQFLMEQPAWKLQWTPREGDEMAHQLASLSVGDLSRDCIPIDIVSSDDSVSSRRADV